MTEPIKLAELPPQLWQRVSDLFDEVLELDEADRIQFIRTIWGSEPQVASELMALLVAAAQVNKTKSLAQAPFDAALGEALSEPVQGYRAGRKFGAWTLEERLGQGGMGEVWRAKRSDGLYKAATAIKLLRTDLPSDKLNARFGRERVVLARLNHPNIARLLDAGIEEGQAFLVLELVKGEPLLDYVSAHANSLNERLRLVRDIALAVEHAHNQLVLHRDLKPSNVLVTANGQVKLLDFGIAGVLDNDPGEPMTKLTQLTGRGMTLEYASPEQITGDPTLPASDVYSLGVLLFHLCTGNRPFAASSTRAALEYAVVNSDPPLASASIVKPSTASGPRAVVDQIEPPTDASRLRGDLDAIIMRAMQQLPEKRYPTATALAADLDAWMSQRPTSIHAGDRTYATRMWFKRHWRFAAIVSLALTMVIAALGVSLWQRYEAVTDASRANQVADALSEILRRHRNSVTNGVATDPASALEQAEREIEARFGSDPATRELLRKRLGPRAASTGDAAPAATKP